MDTITGHQRKQRGIKIRSTRSDDIKLPCYIKSPLYLESQCYPSKKFVGINFSIAELRAFRAVQKIFTFVDYQGNLDEKRVYYDGNNPLNFTGFVTPLKIRIADFLRAYGVNERLKDNGCSRFNAHEREEALKALAQISSKGPLFKYYNHDHLDAYDNHKPPSRIDYIVIEPMPIMVHGIDKHHMLIPPYETEIRQASQGKRIAKEVYTFVGYLIYQAESQRRNKYRDWLTITMDLEQLIATLHLEHYFTKKSRNPKKAYTIITTSIEYACKTGYLHSFIKDSEDKKSIFIFYLHDHKFTQLQRSQAA